ncbi:MAG: DNA polymerase I [Flavobacteriales bacterium]|jgi:DNA polymerase-1|nr:DNA polymerase I [Flavobacteriales bacterium]
MAEKKLFLLDAFALIYRAHFAFARNPRINSKGLNTSAILGFTNAMLDIINNQKPTHIAVVFDAPGGSVRNDYFPEYKAHRDEMPEDIRLAIPYILEVIEGFNIPTLKAVGFEADDVIGTLAKKAEKEGFQTYMMTPDKDFAQLVSENIFMYRPGRMGKPAEVWGIPEVQEKFEVESPLQVIDILGLWGDAADNIPGIPGIGEKTSKKLVAQYGSVEGLIEHVDELKGKQKENVINFAEQGLLSKKLATILLDAPVEFDEKALVLEAPNKEALISLFGQLEFRTMAKRVFGEEIAITQPSEGQMDLFATTAATSEATDNQEPVVEPTVKTIENTKHDYQLIESIADTKTLISKLQAQKFVCFDTETSSLNPLSTQLLGIAFSYQAGTGFYLSMLNDIEEKLELLRPFFINKGIIKIAHNFKFDAAVLHQNNIEIKGINFDTMVAHYLLEPDMKHSMDYLAEVYLNYKPVSIETLIGKKGKNQKSMADLTPEEIYEYACEDADITFQLYEVLKQKIGTPYLMDLFYNMEMPLNTVLMKMEAEGIRLDTAALNSFSTELGEDLINLEKEIIELAGTDFNVDSPKQLGAILFDVLAIDSKAKKTKTGQYKTDEQTLTKLIGKHEIIPLILEYRKIKKLKSTYVDTLPELVDANSNRIHTTYMQTVAATGRLSSNNPNLQNIPIRSEKGKEIRKAFIAKGENYTLLAADYSQIELRIIAALSGDEHMIEAFKNGEDIHRATAAKVFHVEAQEVTPDMRSKAKMVNFGIIYGISAFGLSQRLNISRKEAKEIIDSYFEQYPKIKAFMDNSIAFARDHGYVETIRQRRRYLKDINSSNGVMRGFAERNAINAPIQGSAADIIKLAMIKVDEALSKQNLQTKMLLQVHDELIFDLYKPEEEVVKQLVKDCMENALKFEVPLTVEMGIADNWLEAH